MKREGLKRISEFTGPIWAGLPRRKVDEILGVDITILEFTRRSGRLGDYVLIRAEGADGKEFVTRTGAKAVIGDLEKVQPNLPLIARFEERLGASGRTYLVLV